MVALRHCSARLLAASNQNCPDRVELEKRQNNAPELSFSSPALSAAITSI
eukprot:m.487108 g.487108  ORF g.487108 m.487108 type:complete len:50 (+) comp83061_c0_seq1:191-340(+)